MQEALQFCEKIKKENVFTQSSILDVRLDSDACLTHQKILKPVTRNYRDVFRTLSKINEFSREKS